MTTAIRLGGIVAVDNGECQCVTTTLYPFMPQWPKGYTGQPFKQTNIAGCPVHNPQCKCQCPDCKAGECCKGYYCKERQ